MNSFVPAQAVTQDFTFNASYEFVGSRLRGERAEKPPRTPLSHSFLAFSPAASITGHHFLISAF
jgi:hypothetical protein